MTKEQLQAWRKARGLTQEQAEKWYGVGNGGRTWRRWESGERAIPVPLVRMILMTVQRRPPRRRR